MIRVYDLLKARIMIGDFAPGTRLDPMRLRRDFGSSATPVRDALHRLTGERLIESWRNEGFRIPHVGEPAIRDLYEWTHAISHIVLRAAARHSASPQWRPERLDYPEHLRHLLSYAAARSHSLEFAHAVENLSDRCHLLWRAEISVLESVEEDVAHIEQAIALEAWPEVQKHIDQLHRKRMKAVSAIADWIHNSRVEYAENVF